MVFGNASSSDRSSAGGKGSSYSSGSGYGGGGRGTSSSPGTGADLSEFVEKLGGAVGDDLKKMGASIAGGTTKLREGVGAFLDVLRR